MKRSEINEHILDAEERFRSAGLYLPDWAHWTPEQWGALTDPPDLLLRQKLGWDLTDFGLGSYLTKGLLLFTVRNGVPDIYPTMGYAEKLMVVRRHQVTPMHFHWHKTEDIINRGGGDLFIKMVLADRTTEQPNRESFQVYLDGIGRDFRANDTVILKPGNSITLYPYLYHSFWAENGDCIVGEVSSVNDDDSDNRFLEPLGRFPAIDEDEKPQRLLCTDYAAYVSARNESARRTGQ